MGNIPASTRSERAILGLLLTKSELSMKILGELDRNPEVFSLVAHQQIFQTILGLLSQEIRNYDTSIVISELDRKGNLDDVGGTSYLLKVTADRCSVSSLDGHLKTIMNDFLLRELVIISEILSKEALEALKSPSEIISKLHKDIQGVRVRKTKEKIFFPEGRVERRLDQLIARNERDPLILGFPNLDKLLFEGYLPKHVSVWAGRPGMGKTTLRKNAERNLCMRGLGVVAFSTDQGIEVEEDQMDSLNSGIPYEQIYWSRNWTDDDPRWNKIVESQEIQQKWDYTIVCDRSMETTDIWDIMYRITDRHPVNVIFFDLFDKFVDMNVENNKPQRIGRGLGLINQICEEFNVHGVVLCQVPRIVERRPNKRPRLADLKDSGSYEEVARQVLMLFRDMYYNPDAVRDIMEVCVAKQNNGPSGADTVARFSCRMEIKELISIEQETTSSISAEED